MSGCQHPGIRVPAPPCFSLRRSPSQGSHKDTFSPLPAPVTASPTAQGLFSQASPGTWDSRCNAGSPQHHPTVPSALPGMGQTLQSGSSQPTQHHLQRPQQLRSHRALSAGSPRAALGAVLEDPLPAPPSSPPSPGSRQGCRFYLEPRTNTAEISEVTWHHQSAHGVRPRIPGPASLPLSPSYAHGAHPDLI